MSGHVVMMKDYELMLTFDLTDEHYDALLVIVRAFAAEEERE
jgi:hypothetical protein